MPSCILHIWKSLWQCAWEAPHDWEWNRKQSKVPCDGLKTLLSFLLSFQVTMKWAKTHFTCIFSTFPSVQNPETGSKSNNSKHSSQGQSNTNTRGDFKFHSPEKWLSEASQMQHLQLWVKECSKCEPQSQSFWQQQISHKFWDRTYKNSITQIPFPNYSDYMLK